MSKYSNNGRKHNHEVLSPCTKVIHMSCNVLICVLRRVYQRPKFQCTHGTAQPTIVDLS
jgi:hypothetical protein